MRVSRKPATLIALIILVALSSCSGYQMTEVIQKPVTVANEWSEFTPARPLRCDRKDQEILVDVATPHENDPKSWGLLLRDGSVAIPEVQLIDTNGVTYNFDQRSFWGAIVFRGPPLANHKDFARVMIRSNQPINVSKITWNCYNFEDVKR
jgi:hypothetical protein